MGRTTQHYLFKFIRSSPPLSTCFSMFKYTKPRFRPHNCKTFFSFIVAATSSPGYRKRVFVHSPPTIMGSHLELFFYNSSYEDKSVVLPLVLLAIYFVPTSSCCRTNSDERTFSLAFCQVWVWVETLIFRLVVVNGGVGCFLPDGGSTIANPCYATL